MGRKIFRRTNQPFVRGWAGRALSSEARWVGASINGAAGMLGDVRCPKSVGIIRVASGDGEQEMIREFFPADSGFHRESCVEPLRWAWLPVVARTFQSVVGDSRSHRLKSG